MGDSGKGSDSSIPHPRRPEEGSEGGETGYDEFFRQWYPAFVRMLMMLGATFEEAEEATSAAMVDAYLKWASIGHPAAWVRKAARNYFVNARRRGRMLAQKLLTSTGPQSEVDGNSWEDREWVRQMLDCLPEGQRAVMAHVVDGMKPAEIAELLGKTPEAVRSSLRKARLRLVKELDRMTDRIDPSMPQMPAR